MAQDQKVTLTFKMSDDTEKQVAFTVPGGKDGSSLTEDITQTLVTAATEQEIVQLAVEASLASNPTKPVNTTWTNVTYPDAPEEKGTVTLTVVPTENGKYITIGGRKDSPYNVVIAHYWVPKDGSQVITIFENDHNGLYADNKSIEGSGLHTLPFKVKMSEQEGNNLSVKDDGLFAAAGGLPGLPAASLGDQITPAEFDQKVHDALARTTIPTEVTAEYYGMNVGDYGWFAAYLITIPVSGDGYYVLATGYVQEEPPTKWDMQGYVRVRDGNQTYIVNERTDMSLLLRTLNLYSSDGTVTVTRELNDFDIKSKVLTRKTGGGNFSFNYPDTKTAKNACGKMGSGVYWKVTVSLDSAGNGNTNMIPQFWTTKIPCMEDGTLVPYKFVVDYVAAANNAVPSVAVWLICDGVPTHLMDITTGTATKLQRADNGLTNGLDDLYPLAPEGEFAYEPTWSSTYFYDAFTA